MVQPDPQTRNHQIRQNLANKNLRTFDFSTRMPDLGCDPFLDSCELDVE